MKYKIYNKIITLFFIASALIPAGCTKNFPDSNWLYILIADSILNPPVSPTSPGIKYSTLSVLTSENLAAPAQQVTAVLTTAPTSDVVIPVSSSNLAEGNVSPDGISYGPFNLTFTASNWNTAQTIYVKGTDDAVADTSLTTQYSIVMGTVTTTDASYTGFDPQDIAAVNQDDDSATGTPGLIVVPTAGLVTSESLTSTQFSVVLNSTPSAGVTVNVASNLTSEGTVSPTTLNFTTGNWNVPRIVTITGVNDFWQDGNQPYTVSVSSTGSAAGEYNTAAFDQTVNVTNNDDDTAGITLSQNSIFVSESVTTQTFTVVLNARPQLTQTVSFDASISDGTEALISKDNITYSTGPLTYSFNDANWNSNQIIYVKGVDDGAVDGDITSSITFTTSVSGDPVYSGTFTPGPVSVVTFDNDTVAAPAPGITVNPTTALTTTENGGNAQFAVVLNSSPTNTVTVSLGSSNTGEGTVSPASLNFNNTNWSTPQVVSVTGVPDAPSAIVDGNKAYTVSVSSSGSTAAEYNTAAFDTTVNLTNLDNDAAGITLNKSTLQTSENGGVQQFTVVLNSKPANNISFDVVSSSAAEGRVSLDNATWVTTQPVTINAATWNTPVIVYVKGWDDVTVDGDTAFTINLANLAAGADANYAALAPLTNFISVTNFDNDAGGVPGVHISPTSGLVTSEFGTNADFGVVLQASPPAGCQVNIAFASSNTNAAASPGTISFTPGACPGTGNWCVPKTVTVTGLNSAAISSNTTYTVTTTASTTPAACSSYDGLAVTDVSLTHIANTPGVTVTPVSGLAVSESGSIATFFVNLNSKPTQNVTIDVESLLTTEVQTGLSSAGPFNTSIKTLTFTSSTWNTPQPVYLIGINEAIADGNTNATIKIWPTQSAGGDIDYQTGAIDPADVDVKNVDDDTPGVTVISSSSIVTAESGFGQSFSVVLNSEPTVNVTVPVSVDDTTEASITAPFTGTSGNLTFTAGACPGTGNWCTAQTVTVSGSDDVAVDGDISYNVVIGTTAAVGDAVYNGTFNPADIPATNIDNDTGGGSVGVTVIPTSFSMKEGAPSQQFYVVLNSAPNGNVRVKIVPDDAANATASVAFIDFNAGNWNSAVGVDVTAVNDKLIDGNRLVNMLLTVDGPNTTDTTGYASQNPADVAVTAQDNDKRMFITTTTHDGNFDIDPKLDATLTTLQSPITTFPVKLPFNAVNGDADGIMEVDNYCNLTESGHPGAGKGLYKALLSNKTNGTRVATIAPNAGDGQVDWVLKPLTEYVTVDQLKTIGMTGPNALFTFPLQNPVAGAAQLYWTNLAIDWTAYPTYVDCNGWADNGASVNSVLGQDGTTNAFLAAGFNKCSLLYRVLCVEQ